LDGFGLKIAHVDCTSAIDSACVPSKGEVEPREYSLLALHLKISALVKPDGGHQQHGIEGYHPFAAACRRRRCNKDCA
jgi:hypothetical protein